MPLPNFRDEAEFREKWILPFLQKLGYLQVTHTHGKDEQGKDIIFADFDKFEHIRYYAIQAKNGNIGAANPETDKLLNQVRRMFTVRIRNRKGAEDQRVSAVYVFASGKISDEAREYISDHCRTEHYGENVYFLDGDRLEHLERFADYRTNEENLALLVSLIAEATFNITVIREIMSDKTLSNIKITTQRCRTAAMDQALVRFPHALESDLTLAAPNDTEDLLQTIIVAWIRTDQLNRMLDLFPHIVVSGAQVKFNKEMPVESAKSVLEINERLLGQAVAALDKLREKEKASIEILDDIQ